MSLFAELQRRNVLRVAVGYAVLSWVVLQIMDVLAPALRLPEWTISMVALLLALGVLPVLIFSYVYEMTPDGLKKESEIAPEQSIAAHTAKKLDMAVIALLAVAIVMFAVDRFLPDDGDRSQEAAPTDAAPTVAEAAVVPARDEAIAVLPFADLSPGGDQGYFADGISEEILNLLAQHADLRVIARTSAFQFRDAADLREVGRSLNANRILEGSVRTAGTRVRITAQLIDSETGHHLWSNTYDRQLNDIFAVQDEIAGAITEALGVHLGIEVAAPTVSVSDQTVDAYNLYLQGRQALAERAVPGRINDAIDLLQRAVDADPELVAARGTLALAHALWFNWDVNATREEAVERGLREAERTLVLDPNSVEGLIALGYSQLLEFRIAEAEAALTRALNLRPNDLMAVNLLGDVYRIAGEFDRAIPFELRAVELDPLDPVMATDLAWTYVFAGRFEDALTPARRANLLSPDTGNLQVVLISALIMTGQVEEAAPLLDALDVDSVSIPFIKDQFGIMLAAVRDGVENIEPLLVEMETRWRAQGAPIDQMMNLPLITGDMPEVARQFQAALDAGQLDVMTRPRSAVTQVVLEEMGYEIRYPEILHEVIARQRAAGVDQRTAQHALILRARERYLASLR